MARELELAVTALVHKVYGGRVVATPDWLQRPGRAEAGRRWELVRSLYAELTEMDLPDEMPPRERRTVDYVLQRRGEPPRIVEVDETQHFNRYRAATLRRYPRSVRVAYDRRAWLAACDAKARLEGGGFARPGRRCSRMRTDVTANAPTAWRSRMCCPPSTAGCRRCGSPTSRSRLGSTAAGRAR